MRCVGWVEIVLAIKRCSATLQTFAHVSVRTLVLALRQHQHFKERGTPVQHACDNHPAWQFGKIDMPNLQLRALICLFSQVAPTFLRKHHMTSLLRAWALSLLFCLLPAAWAAEAKLFAQDKAISASYDLAQLGWVKRHAWIRLAPEALSHFSAGATTSTDVSVQLFDDTSFVLHEQSRESVAQGSSTIRYSLRNDSRGNAVFTATQDSLVGIITTGDHRVYRVMPAGGGLHRAEELE